MQVSSTVGTELLSVTIPVSYYTQDIAAGTTATITVDFDGVTGVDSENKSVVDNSRLVYLIQKGYITLSLSANGKSVSYQAEDGDVVEKVPTNGASLSFTLDYATLQAATSERKGTFNIVVSFDWGKYTTYKNPYIYYNSVAKTPTWVEQATTILTDIYNAVSGTDYANPAALTYQVVVSATVNLPA
ncbi:MAG: hypothetical protein IKT32_08115 [Clostridia bacterium]|nr:hypothetical protein [Clostridia bacterium]